MNPLDRVLDALTRSGSTPRRSGSGYACRCPAHDDRSPSLSVNVGENGHVLLHCHAGCPLASILFALDLSTADLRGDGGAQPKPVEKAKYPTAQAAMSAYESRLGKHTQHWVYRDASNNPVGVVCRWDTPTGKKILPIARNGTGWLHGGMPTNRPLYNLPALLASKPGDRVYVCEGEKAADAASRLGLLATTSSQGSQSPAMTDWSPLNGRHVVILRDNDKPGEDYARRVSELCSGALSRCTVLIPGLPEGGDIADVEGREGLVAQIESLIVADPKAFAPSRAGDMLHRFPAMRPPIIHNLLRVGETMNIVAAPKTGKSFLVNSLAIACVTGQSWLGHLCEACDVLLIDAELHHETLTTRLDATRRHHAVSVDDFNRLNVWPVRGLGVSIHDIRRSLAGQRFGVIILDALYRFLPEGTSENDNAQMTAVYNAVDAIAKETGAAIVIVDHTSKGNQSEKEVTDVGAGAGAKSRAADTHVVLRWHEEPGVLVVDATTRSFPPPDPFCVRLLYPGYEPAPFLDPADLKSPGKKKKAQ